MIDGIGARAGREGSAGRATAPAPPELFGAETPDAMGAEPALAAAAAAAAFAATIFWFAISACRAASDKEAIMCESAIIVWRTRSIACHSEVWALLAGTSNDVDWRLADALACSDPLTQAALRLPPNRTLEPTTSGGMTRRRKRWRPRTRCACIRDDAAHLCASAAAEGTFGVVGAATDLRLRL